MSNFWSFWIMALVVINYVAILVLFLWAPRAKIPVNKDGTTGHVWANGLIREGLNRLPMWWLILSTAAFVAAFIYLVRYPGFGNNEGILNWTSEKQVNEQIEHTRGLMQPVWDRIESTPVLELADDKQAMRLGKRLFDDNCAACHGFDAKGSTTVGAPDLTDNVWEYGGTVDDVINSITNGRKGMMPPQNLGYGETINVAHYVMSLSDSSHEASAAEAGEKVFKDTCVACHGPDGTGNQALGAPDLTDDVWKFGSGWKSVAAAVEEGREGDMPAWKDRLNENEIKLLAGWVFSHDNTEAAVEAGDK